MYRKGVLGVTALSVLVTAMPMTSHAATQYSQRKKVIVTANIMDSFESTKDNEEVTRAEFAKMLVRSSSYNNAVSAYNDVSVFPDVAMDHPYASYIRIATEQGWMSAYLGGNFKPEESIKFHEAVRACLVLLGYTDSDFTGNQVASRVTKAQSIGLSSDIAKDTITKSLTYSDCVNLFYNLMITNTKDNETSTKSNSTIYGKLLGFELGDNDEINMLEQLDSELKGPYYLKAGRKLSSRVPFLKSDADDDPSDATFYLNGEYASREDIESSASSYATVVYYNNSTHAVYAYNENGNTDGTMGTAVASAGSFYISYSSSSVMTPTSVTLNGTEYKISNSDMQYAFSLYGSIDYDDELVIVWQTNSDGDLEVVAYSQD